MWLHHPGSVVVSLCKHQRKSWSTNLLDYGLPICNVSQHHALDDAVMFLLWQVFVRDQGSAILGGWGWVHPLQPGMALNLLQGGSLFGIPLKHAVYQTEENEKRREGKTHLNQIRLKYHFKYDLRGLWLVEYEQFQIVTPKVSHTDFLWVNPLGTFTRFTHSGHTLCSFLEGLAPAHPSPALSWH